MFQLLDLPNEILDLIFENVPLRDIWSFQQCSILCEKTLDAQMLARQDAVTNLMLWGCHKGIPWAIKKALSHGADVNVVRRTVPIKRQRFFTIAEADRNLSTVGLLLDLGARLDLDNGRERYVLRRHIFNPDHPETLQVVLDHGGKDQIENFQTALDEALIDVLSETYRVEEPTAQRIYAICKAWLAYGANPARLLEERTMTAIERAISNYEDGRDPRMTIALVELLLSATTEPQSPAVEVYRRKAEEPRGSVV
ncbi:hypothetical protein FAVG1_04122 [Fusarium avenaceum]|nr:hypothetical protein FAVG1_04122 [Fusarium avenaceum]